MAPSGNISSNLKLELTVRFAQEGGLICQWTDRSSEGPLAQCQLAETFFLNIVNFQTWLHRAARIRSVIDDEPLMGFGTRRAQEMTAIWGTRAAVIGVSQWN